ncbi:MAG: efflux RND transporter permease subunit [Bacteroidales bacterium]|jgi:multidrug efflux pump subunit AcrB|nr:efflux RND transporter permease subunit [Bacteroidales bacterium]
MINITEFFLNRKTLFWAFIVALIAGGIYAYIKMPKLEDPLIAVKQAVIITPYPGASAHEVELEVTSIIEEELRTINNILDIQSTSSENLSVVSLSLEGIVPDRNVEQYWDMLRRKVQNASTRLPSGAMAPIVMDDVSDVYGMFYAVTGEDYSYAELEKYTKFLKRELLEVKGVRRIEIFGSRSECIDITIPQEQIARTGIVPTQIMMSIDGQNQPVITGSYRAGNEKVRLAVDGKLTDVESIRNIILQTPTGEQVKLGDIAEVVRTYQEPQTYGFWVDNKAALSLSISMEPDVVVTEVGKEVDQKLKELEHRLPAGISYQKVFFQPDRVKASISDFMWNLISSVIVVIVVLIVAMGMRSGFNIGFGLVFTVLGTFLILYALDGTLQRISLGAFIVAMGMLVDNAVVVMDGILVDRAKGLPPRQALIGTAQRTAIPLLGATLIAIIAFLPVFLSDDSAGEYAGDMFLVFCISLFISWILALVQVPFFSMIMLPARYKAKKTEIIGGELDSPLRRVIGKALSFFMRYKITTLIISIILLVVSALGIFKIKNLFFPDFEYNQLYIEYTLPPQTHPDKVKSDLHEITERLLSYDDVTQVASTQGSTPPRYCLVRSINSGGDNYGEFIVTFPDYKFADKMRPIIEDELRANYPDAYVRVRKYNFSIATSHRVEVMFSGPDPAVLRDLSRQAENIMRASDETDIYSVCNNWNPPGKTLHARYLQQAGKRAGITRSDLGKALMASTDGLPIGMFYDDDAMLYVNMKVRNSDGSRITRLDDIPVWSMIPNVKINEYEIAQLMTGGKDINETIDEMFRTVPLSHVTDGLQLENQESVIHRYNGQRAIKAQCDSKAESTPAAVQSEVKDAIDNIELPDGYTRTWLGEQKMQKDAMANVLSYYPVAVLIMLLILLLLFNSVKKLLLTVLCLPFVLIGIVPTLLLTGTPYTFMSLIGLFGLVGMMIKNEIVLIDEITYRTREGMEPYKAVISSTVNRTRPVIMASLTTIVGMFPLIFDPMYSSLAVAVMSGLAMGTITTLILLPIFYSLLFNIHKPKRQEV